MILDRISIENFRKFSSEVSFKVDNEVLLVGKNNTGKTSISELLLKFISEGGSFTYEDFNFKSFDLEAIDNFYSRYLLEKGIENFSTENFCESNKQLFPVICLRLEIIASDDHDFSMLKPFYFEFENNDRIVISCKYEIQKIGNLLDDFIEYLWRIDEKNLSEPLEDKRLSHIKFSEFVLRKLNTYYMKKYYSTKVGYEKEVPVLGDSVYNLFHVDLINARRDVDDTADQRSNNISIALWEYFIRLNKDKISNDDYFEKPKKLIRESLDKSYSNVFENLLTTMQEDILFAEDYGVSISSDFDIESVLRKNTKLNYVLGNVDLSESYNGLGVSNLVYIYIRIQLFLYNVKDKNKPINILFLEEPESHLHPQLQSTFFEKIIRPLIEDERIVNIISTHSSYVLNSANIGSIRYFTNKNCITTVKSLQDFLDDNKKFERFIIKYFTLANCDLFFADKAIFIEGMSERLLLPQFIKKNDDLSPEYNLSKQNITSIEVGGRYANIFSDLLTFLELKTLIITDIDTVKNKKSCSCNMVNENKETPTITTSNPIIREWFNEDTSKYVINLLEKIQHPESLIKEDENGIKRRLAFQKPLEQEKEWGRTLEEQILIENLNLFAQDIISSLEDVETYETKYPSLISSIEKLDNYSEFNISHKNIKEIEQYIFDNRFNIVRKIEKTNFSLDMIATDDEWVVPTYIKEGLQWLME